MTNWPAILEARRAEVLDRPDSGIGHAIMHWHQMRDAYRWAVGAENQTPELVAPITVHLALAAQAVKARAPDDELRARLSLTDAKLAQLTRWAARASA